MRPGATAALFLLPMSMLCVPGPTDAPPERNTAAPFDSVADLDALEKLAIAPAAAKPGAGVEVAASSDERFLVPAAGGSEHMRRPPRGGFTFRMGGEGKPSKPLRLPRAGGRFELPPGRWMLVHVRTGWPVCEAVITPGVPRVPAARAPAAGAAVPPLAKAAMALAAADDGSSAVRWTVSEARPVPAQLPQGTALFAAVAREDGSLVWKQARPNAEGVLQWVDPFIAVSLPVTSGGKPVTEAIPWFQSASSGLGRLLGSPEGRLKGSAFTASLLPGTYELTMEPEDYVAPDDPFKIVVDAKGAKVTPAMALKKGVVLEGMVLDPAGAPAEGAEITVLSVQSGPRGNTMMMRGGERSTKAGAHGEFRIGGLAEGTLLVRVAAAHFPTLSQTIEHVTGPVTLYLEAGGYLTLDLDDDLAKTARLRANPVRDREADDIGEEGGFSMMGMERELTFRDGRAGPLRAGKYAGVLRVAGYEKARVTFTIEPMEETALRPDLKRLAVVRILFTDRTGKPLEGVTLQHPVPSPDGPPPGWPLTSGADGKVTLPELPEEEAVLAASYRGGNYRVRLPKGDPDREVEETVVLDQPGTLLVRVTPAFRGLSDLNVNAAAFDRKTNQPITTSWLDGDFGLAFAMAEGATLAEGQSDVRIGPFAPGDYEVTLQEPGAGPMEPGRQLARAVVTLPAGAELPVELAVRALRTVRLQGFPVTANEGLLRFEPGLGNAVRDLNRVDVPADATALVFHPDAMISGGSIMITTMAQWSVPVGHFGESDTWVCPAGRLSLSPPSGTRRIEVSAVDNPAVTATAESADSKVFAMLPPGSYRIRYLGEKDALLTEEVQQTR